MKGKFTYKQCIGAGILVGSITIAVAITFPAPLPSDPCTVSKVLTFSCFHDGRGHIFMAGSYTLIVFGLVWGAASFLKQLKTKYGSNGQ